jgi:hypothetical protein
MKLVMVFMICHETMRSPDNCTSGFVLQRGKTNTIQMKTRTLTPALLPLLFLLLLVGCKKDFEFDKIKPPSWTPDIAIPLIDDNITFEDVLKVSGASQNYFIDDNGDISILYYFKNNAFLISVNDLLAFPPFPFSFDHQFTAAETQMISTQDVDLPPVTYSYNLADSYSDIRIDRILIKQGTIALNLNSSFSNGGHLVVRFPHATKNGAVFTYTSGPITAGSTTDTINLSNVLFDLTSSQNTLTFEVQVSLKQSDKPAAGDMIHMDCNLKIPAISRFEGYLGNQTYTPQDESVMVTAFHNAYALGNVYFIDPKASITMVNSFGIPMKVTVKELRGENMQTGQIQDITTRLGSSSVFTVPAPSMNATAPVTAGTDFTNTNTNGGMEALFSIKPDNVYYKISTEINPQGKSLNFFTDTSKLYANLQVRLPLYGHFDNLTVQDTFDFSLNGKNDVESICFHASFTNGFPLSGRIQLYFTDPSYHVLDSLTGSNSILIKEAPVDPATHLPQPGMFGQKDTSFYFDQSRLSRLVNSRYMFVKAVLNSNNGGITNVKIKATQALKLHLGAEAKMKAN